MKFNYLDFDSMREWLKKIAGPKVIRKGRVIYFDSLRYREDYETIYNFIEGMGGIIIYENRA